MLEKFNTFKMRCCDDCILRFDISGEEEEKEKTEAIRHIAFECFRTTTGQTRGHHQQNQNLTVLFESYCTFLTNLVPFQCRVKTWP